MRQIAMVSATVNSDVGCSHKLITNETVCKLVIKFKLKFLGTNVYYRKKVACEL